MSYYDRDKAPNDGSSTYTVSGNLGWPRPHLNHAPEYQASGFPFAYTILNDQDGNINTVDKYSDGAIFKVQFPQVTRWLLISAHQNNDKAVHGSVHVGFHADCFLEGTYVDTRFFDTARLELKCSEVYIRLSISNNVDHIEILAGLTNISVDDMSRIQAIPKTTTEIEGLNIAPTVTIS